jgi:hypothetical protein
VEGVKGKMNARIPKFKFQIQDEVHGWREGGEKTKWDSATAGWWGSKLFGCDQGQGESVERVVKIDDREVGSGQ